MAAPGAEKAITGIQKWIQREEWQGPLHETIKAHLSPVCDEHKVDMEDLGEKIGAHYAMLAVATAIEDFLTGVYEPDGRNPIDDYLKRRGFRESGAAKRWLRALRSSVMSLYEIVDLVPGSHVVVRDMIREGESIRVDDFDAYETAARWDRIAARVLDFGDRCHFAPSVLPFPMETADTLAAGLNRAHARLKKEGRPFPNAAGREGEAGLEIDRLLSAVCPFLTHHWLSEMLIAGWDPLGTLAVPEADKIPVHCAEYPVADTNRGEIERRLNAEPELTRESAGRPRWEWHVDDSENEASPASAGEAAAAGEMATLQGMVGIELTETSLVTLAFAPPAAERARALIADVVGDLTDAPTTEVRTLLSLLERYTFGIGADELTTHADESESAIRDRLRRSLGKKLPDLDGKTPRQAARSRSRRSKLAEWLKRLENRDGHRARVLGQEPHDFRWLWEELGIAELRR